VLQMPEAQRLTIFDKTTTVIARGNQKYETPVLKVNAVNKV